LLSQDKTSLSQAQDTGADIDPPSISPLVLDLAQRELLLGSVMNLAEFSASFCHSAAQAAFRGDERLIRKHLVEARSSLIATLQAFNQLNPQATNIAPFPAKAKAAS
jgi:hypothetical protein